MVMERVSLVTNKDELGEVPPWFGTWMLLLLREPLIDLMPVFSFHIGFTNHKSMETELRCKLNDRIFVIWLFFCELVARNEDDLRLRNHRLLDVKELFVVALCQSSL